MKNNFSRLQKLLCFGLTILIITACSKQSSLQDLTDPARRKTPTSPTPVVVQPATVPTTAFPGATGFGKNTKGAYAKYMATGNAADLPEIIYVDNLNDAGTGSLRAALTATFPRIVVFRTGGTINLASLISITSPYVTVAGFTAPGGGILLKGATLWIRTKEVIIRNIRFRNGVYAAPDFGTDGVNISAYVTSGYAQPSNIILDHCSVSWTSDGGFDMNGSDGGVENITIQNSILAEGFGGHSLLLNLGTNVKNVSIHRNYFANAEGRMPRFGPGVTGTVINNIMFNWQTDAFRVSEGTSGDVLYNKFKYGPITSESGKAKAIRIGWDGISAKTQMYLLGNTSNGSSVAYEANSGAASDLSSVPHYTSTVYGFNPETNMSTLENTLLTNAGAFPRDAVDTRLVNGYYTNTGSIPTSTSVLDYPFIATGTYPVNNNGVSLTWLVTKGYAIDNAAAAALSKAYLLTPGNGKSGYAIIEEFINDTGLAY